MVVVWQHSSKITAFWGTRGRARFTNRPDFAGAERYALKRLQRELASDLTYHSLWHTRNDVLPAVERLAAMEGVGDEDRLLLRTAAAYHDLGFVESHLNHEATGIRIACETLPDFGFSARQVQVVAGLIQATKLPQSPRNLLEQIMADADLDGLGRNDFFRRSLDLRNELAAYGKPASDDEWYSYQLKFVGGHTYFTASARALRDPQKQRNLAALAARLGTSLPDDASHTAA